METVPWYQSAIVRQQISQVIVALIALFGVNLGGLDVDATLVSIFAGIAALIAVYTTVTRIFKPAPNLSTTAAKKEVELVAARKIPPSPTGPGSRQGGNARAGFLIMLAAGVLTFVVGAAVMSMSGCAGTTAAYKASHAEDRDLADVAYVVAEHYAAVVREAADLAQNGTTAPEVIRAMQAADRIVKPLIVGNAETGAPGLQQAAARYSDVKSAQTQAELQVAIDNAARELAKFVNAVKAARRN